MIGMNRKKCVISLRRNYAAAVGTGINVRFRDKTEAGNRSFRPGQLPADQHRQNTADHKHEQADKEKLPGDHLVIQ